MAHVPDGDGNGSGFTAHGEVDAYARGADRGGGVIVDGADAFVLGPGFDMVADPAPWGGDMPAALHLVAFYDTAEGVRLGAG